ncbi:uncharacterized protein LOC144635355 [Oculina patagonica]
MAQTFFLSILALAVFLCPLCPTQSIESSSLQHDASQIPTIENSESYPPGCKLYQNRKLLQCRNTGLQVIPELNEDWNVKTVDLSSNNISTLQFGNGYKNVKSINLERNNITTVAEELILELQHIHFLSIEGNPFHCDCKLKWLRERLLGSNNQFPHVRHIQDLKCITPARFQGRNLVTISEELLCGTKPEDRFLRSTTQVVPTVEDEKLVNSTVEAELLEAREKAKKRREKGRIVEIIGVTFAFAATIGIMSVAFIVM